MKIKYKEFFSIRLSELCLIFYLCFPFLMFGFSVVLKRLDALYLVRSISLFITYFPLVIMIPFKRRITLDFWIIWGTVVLFFFFSYLAHPEYEHWYTRPEYGVIDYVMSPENGIYIYLLLRLVGKPKDIIKCIKISSWPMYLYCAWQIRKALIQGYWIDTSNRGYEIHLSYNLSLGYSVLLFTLAYLYCAFENRKVLDWVGAIVGIAIILMGGSRGPMLAIAIFLILYAMIKMVNAKKRLLLMGGLLIIGMCAYILLPYILDETMRVMNNLGISSRFLTKLLNGTITDDAGRSEIWRAAIDMIRTNPLGYGAMGSRHVISKYIYVAHPHQVFLELLIDFGVFFGGFFIVMMTYYVIKLFNMKGVDEWKGVFLIFFSRACQLLVSLTFWHSIGLWGTLAIGVCMLSAKKKQERNVGLYGE